MYFFVSCADFGLLPTLTACVIQNGRTPLLLLWLLLLILPRGETTVLYNTQPIKLSFLVSSSPSNSHMLYVRYHFRPILHTFIVDNIEFVRKFYVK